MASPAASGVSWPRLATVEELDRELAIDCLADFVRQAWGLVEPGTELLWNWHLDIICDALERQIRGDKEYRKLLICIPPGSMKSLLVAVFAPAWQWLENPERRKLFLANDDGLATRDSRRTRQIITSEWYQDLVDLVERRNGLAPWELAFDQNQKVNFANTRHGFRQCLSIGSRIIGKRGDDIVLDDPIDAKDVINGSVEQVAARLEQVARVVEKVLPSRVNLLAEARWTIIMQRLHENDTAGRAINEGGWKVINIQMEYEPDNPLNHPDDPRTKAGELMFEGLFPREEVEKLKGPDKLGNDYSAHYQQNPLPRGGGPLKRWYWRFWYPRGLDRTPNPVMVRLPDGAMHSCKQTEVPEKLTAHTQSWDMTFKDTKKSAFVVGQVWAQLGPDAYLLDQVREKMDIVATIDAVKVVSKNWPEAIAKLIEDKANGPAVMAILRKDLPGLIPVEPEGGKEARANASTPVARAGNIYLPHPSLFPWVWVFIAECEAFPAGTYADQVDTFTQYVIYRYGSADGRCDGYQSVAKRAQKLGPSGSFKKRCGGVL